MAQKRAIYLVETKTRYQLAAMFMRFQEHYESPQFRKKIFSVEEYMDWYAEQYGNFTYCSDWRGFNVPSWVFTPFYQRNFDPLLKKEEALLEILPDTTEDFYVIGVSNEAGVDSQVLKHEFVHGLFYTEPQYRKDVLQILSEADTKVMHAALLRHGYCNEVLEDETNAYLLTSTAALKLTPAQRKSYEPLRRQLEKVFKEHFGVSIKKLATDTILEQIHRISV